MEKDEKAIDSFINYIIDLAVECRKKCIANETLDVDLNNDDIIKAFGYAYTHGYLQGQRDAMADTRKHIEDFKNILNKNKE